LRNEGEIYILSTLYYAKFVDVKERYRTKEMIGKLAYIRDYTFLMVAIDKTRMIIHKVVYRKKHEVI
jgi:hypothetical protein